MTKAAEIAAKSYDETGGKPIASYIKAELGKLFVNDWDIFTDEAVGLLLEGDPRKREEGCILDIFTERQHQYVKRMNKKQFETGALVPYVRKEEPKEKTFEESTDSELEELLNKPFFSLQKAINNTESEAVLFRLLSKAEELDKSEKITGIISSRISEIQSQGYDLKSEPVEE